MSDVALCKVGSLRRPQVNAPLPAHCPWGVGDDEGLAAVEGGILIV